MHMCGGPAAILLLCFAFSVLIAFSFLATEGKIVLITHGTLPNRQSKRVPGETFSN